MRADPSRIRLEFPMYDGSSDPRFWLKKCEWLFLVQRVEYEDKVYMAALHLEGEALSWFIVLDHYKRRIEWDEFKTCCHDRFGPEFHRSGLQNMPLRQTGTVVEFQRHFEESWLLRVSAPSQEEAVKIFVGGLKEEIGARVRSEGPKDLARAMSLAKYYERTMN